MVKKDNFSLYYSDEQKKCESFLFEKCFFDSVPEHRCEPQIEDCYRKVMTIARKTSDFQKSKNMLSNLISLPYPTSRFAQISEESKTDHRILASVGQWLIDNAIYFSLSHENLKKTQQLFEWAAEDCTLPNDYLQASLKNEDYDELSFAYLWLGYALICLGQYSEALEYISNVVPFCEKWKKITGEIYWRIEFALPKALIPLCKFKLNPTRQNLINTQNGIEEYIKSLREPRFKLDGYLYYFHLKEQFADVYSANPKDYPEEAAVPAKESVKKIPASESGEPQNVWIWDVVSATSGEEFGTDNELRIYAEYVKNRGGFPSLSSLMDLYLLWDEVDARELADEAGRLLAMKDLDSEIRKKTEIIKTLADYSAAKGSGRLVLKPENPE